MNMASNPTVGSARPGPQLSVAPDVTHWTDRASRPNNEDFYTIPPYANLPSLRVNPAAASASRGLVYVVADGMGGAAKGEMASRLAVRSLVETYYADPDPDLRSSLWRALHAANEAVYRESLASPGNQGMGTTLTALVLHENRAYFGHVGDSRLYRLRSQHLQRLSHDHSLVQELVDKGTLTLEQARLHPERNKIQRAIGTGPMVDVDTGVEEIALGDTFLLSTDGLHDELSDAQIQQLLSTSGRDAPESLGRAARSVNGGPDNITAVWVRVGPREGPIGGAGRRPRPKPLWERYAYPLAAALVALVGVGWVVRKQQLVASPFSPVVPTEDAAPLPRASATSREESPTSIEEIVYAVPLTDTPVATQTATAVPATRLPRPAPSPTEYQGSLPSSTPYVPVAPSDTPEEKRTKPEPTKPPEPTEPPEPTKPPGPTEPPEPTKPPGPTEPPPQLLFAGAGARWSAPGWWAPHFRGGLLQNSQFRAEFDPELPASGHLAFVLPAFSGSVRSNGSQDGEFARQAPIIESSAIKKEGSPIGVLQFNLASLPQRWIEGAKLELVLKEKGNALDTSAWNWTIDVLDPSIHGAAWVMTRYSAFDNATPVAGVPIVLRHADVQKGIRSASAFERCEAVQAMNSALARPGGSGLIGLRIEAGGDRASAVWHSGQAAEPTLWPQLALELGPEGGPTPTICPVGASTAPPPTVSQPSSTPITPTLTPSPSPSGSGTPVTASSTPTPKPSATEQPSPSATSTASNTPSAIKTPSPTARPTRTAIYLPLAIRGAKIYALNMVRVPDPAMGPGASVLPALATCEDTQSSEAYGIVSIGAALYRSQDGEQWTTVNDLDDLSITDLALTSDCSLVLVAKWGGGVYSGRPEANSLQRPLPSSPPTHRYPYALAADSSRVVYGASIANNDTGGVFESPIPSDRSPLVWTRMGTDLLNVRSLLLAGEQEVYAGTTAGAWTYKFRLDRWERTPSNPPATLANERVLSMLPVGSTPARRMIYLGTAGEGLWQKAGDSASPATNWPGDLGKASVTSLTSFGDLVLAAVNGHGVYYSRSTPPKWVLLPRSPKNAARVGFLTDDLLVVARDGSIWLHEDAAEALK